MAEKASWLPARPHLFHWCEPIPSDGAWFIILAMRVTNFFSLSVFFDFILRRYAGGLRRSVSD
jgi:hypothetical protein